MLYVGIHCYMPEYTVSYISEYTFICQNTLECQWCTSENTCCQTSKFLILRIQQCSNLQRFVQIYANLLTKIILYLPVYNNFGLDDYEIKCLWSQRLAIFQRRLFFSLRNKQIWQFIKFLYHNLHSCMYTYLSTWCKCAIVWFVLHIPTIFAWLYSKTWF